VGEYGSFDLPGRGFASSRTKVSLETNVDYRDCWSCVGMSEGRGERRLEALFS